MLIRCTYCETEVIVKEEPSSFKCKFKEGRRRKECGHTRYDILRTDIPELFAVKDGGSFLHAVREGVGIFEAEPRGLFFTQEDADRVIGRLAEIEEHDRDYYHTAPAAWERGSYSQITRFENLWPN